MKEQKIYQLESCRERLSRSWSIETVQMEDGSNTAEELEAYLGTQMKFDLIEMLAVSQRSVLDYTPLEVAALAD